MIDLTLMQSCPRWERCNAPVCPADPDSRRRVHRQGEHVCLYLTEIAKNGGGERLQRMLSTPLLEAVAESHQDITAPTTVENLPQGHAVIARTIAKAATTGSRIEANKRAGKQLHRLSTGPCTSI